VGLVERKAPAFAKTALSEIERRYGVIDRYLNGDIGCLRDIAGMQYLNEADVPNHMRCAWAPGLGENNINQREGDLVSI
jgi:hypothetical protein